MICLSAYNCHFSELFSVVCCFREFDSLPFVQLNLHVGSEMYNATTTLRSREIQKILVCAFQLYLLIVILTAADTIHSIRCQHSGFVYWSTGIMHWGLGHFVIFLIVGVIRVQFIFICRFSSRTTCTCGCVMPYFWFSTLESLGNVRIQNHYHRIRDDDASGPDRSSAISTLLIHWSIDLLIMSEENEF